VFLAAAMTNEPDSLARSYSILSWADVALALQHNISEQVWKIERLKAQEKSPNCILSYCYVLYNFGKKDILDELLSYLHDRDYHVRCTATSFLSDIIDETNNDLIKNSIKELLTTEVSRAVRDKAEKFLLKH
jgi:hypothetical protein